MGACAILPRIIGQGRASELLYTGSTMSAEDGLAWGYYNAVVPKEQLLDKARKMARSLAEGPAFAHFMTKKCLHQEWNQTIEQALETEAEAQAICMQTKDFTRAYNAFVAKEKPKFEGN
jgi:enoyl-CoA hydratase/carnithine racemase